METACWVGVHDDQVIVCKLYEGILLGKIQKQKKKKKKRKKRKKDICGVWLTSVYEVCMSRVYI